MNTRLQVEHPVTEMVTGLDLVEWQLRVAAGEELPLRQPEVWLQGHAIEARLYAEDPYSRPTPFAPQAGRVRWWRPEASAAQPGVRIDHGIVEGGEVSPFYDAMVAKLIVHGRDRDDAIRRLRAALRDAPLLGLRNNGCFLADLVDHPDFCGAAMTTTSIDRWFEQGESIAQRPLPTAEAWCVAAAAFTHGAGWRADSVAAYDIELRCDDGETERLRVCPGRGGAVQVVHRGASHEVGRIRIEPGKLDYHFDGVQRRAVALRDGSELYLALGGASFMFSEPSALASADAGIDERRVRAAVAGVVTQVLVQPGDTVAAGQALVCVEAMKMEMWLAAPTAAVVLTVLARVGEQVAAGTLLAGLEPQGARGTS
jgi:geranyl-CoA carboxylase alpha subunit